MKKVEDGIKVLKDPLNDRVMSAAECPPLAVSIDDNGLFENGIPNPIRLRSFFEAQGRLTKS